MEEVDDDFGVEPIPSHGGDGFSVKEAGLNNIAALDVVPKKLCFSIPGDGSRAVRQIKGPLGLKAR
ncbi:MAG: hypothetical protein AAGC83_07140 [Pseudomonadota bacterium]